MKPTKKCRKLPNSTRKRMIILTTLGVIFSVLAITFYVVDPVLLVARYQMRVAPGYQIYDILHEEIAGAYVSAYLFNVTNAQEFLSGEDHQLKVQEVGPFTYQEKRVNKNFEVDEEMQELRYEPYITTTFIPEMSIADPADINITIPNTALLSIATAMSASGFWVARMGLNVLTMNLNSKAILTMPAKDYLWGYDEPLLAFGNTVVPGWIDFRQMGLMDRLYDNSREYKVTLSLKEEAKFQIKRVNGVSGLPLWGYDDPTRRTRCNTFEDTYEGFSYPPGVTPETTIRLFRNVFCRIVEVDYVGTRDVDYGPQAYIFKISNRTYCKSPEKECLCSRLGCVDGLSDLSPCFYDLPLMMSNAHFYGADPKVYERIEGLDPLNEEHGSEFLIDPKLGTEISTSMTFQLNVPVTDVSYNKMSKPFTNMTVPIAYFKVVQPELADDVKRVFWIVYVAGPYGMFAVEVVLLVVGLSMLASVIRTVYWNCLIRRSPLEFQIPKPENRPHCETPLMKKQNPEQ